MKIKIYYKTRLIFISLFLFIQVQFINAQNEIFIGANIIHPLIIKPISNLIAKNTNYLPIHIVFNYAKTKNFGFSALFMYRLEKDGYQFNTNEFGIAIGPAYYSKSLDGFFIDLKGGFAYAYGKDYGYNTYSRIDVLLQFDLGFFFQFCKNIRGSCGIGIQSLIPIYENPSRTGIWEWNGIGILSHYFLPVANFSLGFGKSF